MEMRCDNNADVRQFLDDLHTKREELAACGVDITTQDYRSTIIASIPDKLSDFALSLIASSQLVNPTKDLDPDFLICHVSNEYERRRAKKPATRTAGVGGKSAKREQDEAMAVAPGKGKGGWKPRGSCWNCGEKGHYKDKCPKPQKPSKGSGGSRGDSVKARDNTNVVVDYELDSDGGWAMYCDSDDECNDTDDVMPTLEELESSDDDEEGLDGLSGVGEVEDVLDTWMQDFIPDGQAGTEGLASSLMDPPSPLTDVPDPLDPEDEAAVMTTADDTTDSTRKELYDSGTTRHISPYRQDFVTYHDIPLWPFKAANKQLFDALGMGEMVIEVPNGMEACQLRLTEVLYSPEVGYTLVSIGRLDELGYTTTFADGQCVITDPDGEQIGQIPRTKWGLYRVVRDCGSTYEANAAVEKISVMELHRRMGHIAPSAAKHLVNDGFVTGVSLNTSTEEPTFFCDSCIYTKAKRQPIAKTREGDCASVFWGEIHTDLWGPAPVETLRGRCYYVTFTDDKTRLTHLHFLRHKSDTFGAYKAFEAWCHVHQNSPIKILHSDRGGEYLSTDFVQHLRDTGTEQKLTVHDTPQHNGVAVIR